MSEAAACYHCHEPLGHAPATAVIGGNPESFCCLGCATAARWITEHGLVDYYRLRTASAGKAGDAQLDYTAWDRPEIQNAHCRPCPEGRQITLITDGMHCAACAWLIQKALQTNPAVGSVNANAITGRVDIRWDPVREPLSALCRQLNGLGYRPYLSMSGAYEREKQRERNRLLLKLGLAALVTTQTMMFSEALYLDTAREMSTATRDFFRWLTFLLCSPVVFYSGSEFITGMLREIRMRRPGMDTLAATSILLAYFASLQQTLTGGEHVWFDASAMFVLFLLSARVLERFARSNAHAQLDKLARAQPAFAWRRNGERHEQCPVEQIRDGDILLLVPGESVPADGELLGEAVEVDESLLTGEPELQTRRRGQTVLAGSTVGPLSGEIRASRTGPQTQLSQMLRLVEQAQQAKPAQHAWAERLASRFVLLMFGVTLMAFAVWWRIDAERAFPVALAVLVAACPCALALALPAAVSSSLDALARQGVLVIRPDALPKLGLIDHIVFDKTGTLTTGQAVLTGITLYAGCDRQQALQAAYGLELGSKHPLAKAFDAFDGPAPAFDAARAVAGQGVEGVSDGSTWRLGKAAFAAPGQADEGIWLSRDATPLAHFRLDDPIKPGARDDLDWIRHAGLHSHLLSGDGAGRVGLVADALGIADRHARMTPAMKLDWIVRLQEGGGRVLMVGDGINDAPAMARADVSMAMGSGAWLAQHNADILLMNSRLSQIGLVFTVARHMQRLMRQNLRWAIAYNVLAVGIALSGFIHPGYAALGMAGSSLLVTLNALRIHKVAS